VRPPHCCPGVHVLHCTVPRARTAEVMPCSAKVRNNSLRTDISSSKSGVTNKKIGRKERVRGAVKLLSLLRCSRDNNKGPARISQYAVTFRGKAGCGCRMHEMLAGRAPELYWALYELLRCVQTARLFSLRRCLCALFLSSSAVLQITPCLSPSSLLLVWFKEILVHACLRLEKEA